MIAILSDIQVNYELPIAQIKEIKANWEAKIYPSKYGYIIYYNIIGVVGEKIYYEDEQGNDTYLDVSSYSIETKWESEADTDTINIHQLNIDTKKELLTFTIGAV